MSPQNVTLFSRVGPLPTLELHEVPPSSLAAIVQNLSKANGTPQLTGRDDFQQLLAELLGPSESDGGDGMTLEEDVVMNYRLIQIVTSAGITVLLQDDPFAVQEDLLLQASNSLLVIRKAIRRGPQVLFCPPPLNNELNESDQTILFLWLLPRLFPLLGHPNAEKLLNNLLETIECVFVAATKIPEAWKYLKELISYCRSCFLSIIAAFQSTARITAAMSKSFHLELPGQEFQVHDVITKEQINTNPRLLKFFIRCPTQAGLIAVHIFSTFARLIPISDLPGLRIASDNAMWMLHGISNLWESLSAWETVPMLQDSISTLKRHIISALCKTMEGIMDVGNRLSIRNVATLTLRCTIEVLHRGAEKVDQCMEPVLASVVLTMLQLVEHFPSILKLLNKHLYPWAVSAIHSQNIWPILSSDFQIAIIGLLITLSPDASVLNKANGLLLSISSGKWVFKDTHLQKKAETLAFSHASEDTLMDGVNIERPQKRARMTPSPENTRHTADILDARTLISQVYQFLGNQEALDLAGLSLVAANGFNKITERDRFIPVRMFGLIACALAGTLEKGTSKANFETWGPYYCSFCDCDEVRVDSCRITVETNSSYELFTTLENLIKLDEFRASPQARIWGMMSLRRLLNHTGESAYLDIESSALGQWCLQTLNSSMRELRIAASRTLPSFVNFSHDEQLLKANRYTIIAFLKTLSETEDSILQETCVVTWGQIGRMLSDQELNLALIALVQFLGHSNAFIIGVAYNEIQALATAHKETPRRLFTPFWRSISPSVVKQLQSRPQIAQLLSELCGLEVSEFLILTQSYTLPYLILFRKNEIIERITQAIGNTTVKEMCVTKSNMTAILAVLLTQDIDNAEMTAINLLQSVSPEFGKVSFADLVRSDPIPLAEELIKMAGDENETKNETKKEKIFDALQTPGASKKEKKVDPLGIFFENNVLGIMAQFSDTIHDVRGRSTPMEKIRCLRGIGEMVKLSKGCATSALPQICACLQSAMKSETLRKHAFGAWVAVMSELPEEDVLPLVGQTLSVILQYWEQLPCDSKEEVQQMVVTLFDQYPKQLEEHVHSLPSLSSIQLMAKQEAKLQSWKDKKKLRNRFLDFAARCRNENAAVVEQALIELSAYLQQEQSFIHSTAMSEQPDVVVSELMRCLLDSCVQYKDTELNISHLSAECLGIIGAVDPSRVDAPRASKQLIILHNFELAEESLDFVTFLLEHRLVKTFLAATDTKAQGFLAYSMQELLKFCEFDANVVLSRRSTQIPATRRWREFSETARSILTPYLTSKYVLTGNPPTALASKFPIFTPEHTYRSWIQEFLFDLMAKVRGNNATAIFSICSRIIKGQDIAISNFILPYVTLNVVISGTDSDREQILNELLVIVEHAEGQRPSLENETLRDCSEAVFLLVDYFSKWLKEKKQYNSNLRAQAARVANRHVRVDEDEVHDIAVSRVEKLLAAIPPDIMGIRSFECKSYPRALFYWEQHIRQARQKFDDEQMRPLYERLQHIYAQIDEPDGIEGISAQLKIYTIDQQIIEHRNAGRWTAAQSWYEMQLATRPNDVELQANLLSCLKESGQYDNLLHQADYILKRSDSPSPKIIDLAVEASWLAEKWDYLDSLLKQKHERTEPSYEIHMGEALSAFRAGNLEAFDSAIQTARQNIVKGLSHSSTGTLDQCHPNLLKLHALFELQSISTALRHGVFDQPRQKDQFVARLQRRLDLLGTSTRDKQYILAIRRAVFGISNLENVKHDLALNWLATARLARKAGRVQQAFHAILQSTKLGEQSATVEHARLLWHEGQHRKAIQSLQGVIDAKILNTTNSSTNSTSVSEISADSVKPPQNFPLAKANLLLAKWLDTAGHLHSTDMTAQYQKASNTYLRWEQGFYYLGRHYNKLYEAHKNLPPAQQPQPFLIGETAKLICQCYLRSLPWGTKYIFQTLPRFLTLWLDLGEPLKLTSEHGSEQFRNEIYTQREKQLSQLHNGLIARYIDKIQAYMWYTVLPQILSRICHQNQTVYHYLEIIIAKVVSTHPQQALWSLMAVLKSTQKERISRGVRIIGQIQATAKASKNAERKQSKGVERADMRVMINQAQRLTEQLLRLCNAELPGKPVAVSLRSDLGFDHSVAPCPLVIPVQAVLSATLPSTADSIAIRTHAPFAHEQPTIHSFSDDADVMSSLQKPRKITVTGSNGAKYKFLCKPKDDLRKDARLMEFASMINRLLKKESAAIQRRLHIRTYHVTPLNEECGLIEWVNNVRPFRDILFKQYKKRGIIVNVRQFNQARAILDEACSHPSNHHLFNSLLQKYPPVLHEWFVDHFPDPASWLSSRIGYARTSAVWSMVGNVLGLGDRHGENILLDETNGDTAHVDFNCLFDKGLTFEKPEMVPFRLTHNMVDGFGVSGYEGPFRRSCEVVTRILRLNEATLMTVLEAFLYDPAVDMNVRKARKHAGLSKAPDNPKDVLDGIRTKIQGLFPGEGMPLSVEGQVQELIRKAVASENLCKMYIGWMSFF
ncbi:hypothetical protein BDZ91DRAFT_776018 [Kalaharituber pfeilii]|nr:hypothetical protein BDZ91DRAFT_776018 [Kalaharituber pfeilii]